MIDNIRRIGDLGDVFDGPHATPKKTEEGPYFLSISSLDKGTLFLDRSAHLSEVEFVKWTKRVTPKKDDLLFSYETRLGEAALMPDGIKACLGRRMGLIRPNTKIVDPQFLLYSYLSPAFQNTIKSNTITGATVDRISLNEFPDFPIWIPPLAEQKKIAKVLSTLDAKIELNNQINAELEAMAKLLYDYWFVQFDFPMTAEQASALGQPELAGKPYKTSGGKMVFNPTLKREIPEGWEAGTLDKLGEVIGGSTPSKANDGYFCAEGTPWITPKDLSNNKGKKFIQRGSYDVSEEGKKAASLKVMPAGTVLLSSRAPIGYTAIASNPLTTNQGFKSFVPNRGFGTDYVYRTLNHFMKLIEQNASGSTFKEISGGTLKAIKIPFPNNELEKDYAKKVSPISSQQQNLEKQNQELTELRDWLLPMLMNGQVVVE